MSVSIQTVPTSPETARAQRRNDLEWLKVVATLGVFLFHTARFFDYGWWHVKDESLSAGLTVLASFLLQWIMPLFFVISGASIRFALRRRTSSQFLRERAVRILFPLVAGILLIVPPQVYLERLTRGEFAGSFLEFYPAYFDGWYGFGGNFAWMGLHLWYLLVLLVFSSFLLPVLRFFLSAKGSMLLSRLSAAWATPIGVILVPAIPLMLAEAFLHPMGLGAHVAGGWSIPVYALLFLYGTILHANERLERALYANQNRLFLATITTFPFLIWGELWGTHLTHGTIAFALFMAVRAFNMWLWVVVLLSLGHRYLDRSSPALVYMAEATLPFYILHQTIILVVGYQLLDWKIATLPKYLALSFLSFSIIMFTYHYLIRPLKPLRLMFGLKLK